MAGLGHNRGPALTGTSWRRHCWTEARAALLPHLPIEVLRGRVRRAQELGLDYKTYASIRAASGHDVVAFLFSSNALRLAAPAVIRPRLTAVQGCARIGLAVAPLTPEALAEAMPPLHQSHPAPHPYGRFAEARTALRTARGAWPADGVVLVGDAPFEAEWCAAGKLAYYLPATRVFTP